MILTFKTRKKRKLLLAAIREVTLGNWGVEQFDTGTNRRGLYLVDIKKPKDPYSKRYPRIDNFELEEGDFKDFVDSINSNIETQINFPWRHNLT